MMIARRTLMKSLVGVAAAITLPLKAIAKVGAPHHDEPDYIAQTDEPRNPAERVKWYRECGNEAWSQGVRVYWVRITHHPTIPNLTLIEFWERRPDNEGEPRWQLEAI